MQALFSFYLHRLCDRVLFFCFVFFFFFAFCFVDSSAPNRLERASTVGWKCNCKGRTWKAAAQKVEAETLFSCFISGLTLLTPAGMSFKTTSSSPNFFFFFFLAVQWMTFSFVFSFQCHWEMIKKGNESDLFGRTSSEGKLKKKAYTFEWTLESSTWKQQLDLGVLETRCGTTLLFILLGNIFAKVDWILHKTIVW